MFIQQKAKPTTSRKNNISTQEKSVWTIAQQQNTESSYRAYLQLYPDGKYKNSAELALESFADMPSKDMARKIPDNSKTPTTIPNASTSPNANGNILPDFPNQHQMKFIPSGTFTMGCTSEQKDCESDEKPLRKVTLDAYWMDVHEVTNEQYARFLNEYGSDKVKNGAYKGEKMIKKYKWGVKKVGSRWQAQSGYEKHPVVYVTWYGANEYARHYGLRLPTEAEWEYAARGAARQNEYLYAGSNNLEEVAWYNKNSRSTTHRVMTKKANMLGLFDMSGNVWEWCADYWKRAYPSKDERNPKGAVNGQHRVQRGGSWCNYPMNCRVSNRDIFFTSIGRLANYGFRCAKSQ
ncbi:MAG: formylglycine-generating enzyme family protein [Bacteroidota bacterium]